MLYQYWIASSLAFLAMTAWGEVAEAGLRCDGFEWIPAKAGGRNNDGMEAAL